MTVEGRALAVVGYDGSLVLDVAQNRSRRGGGAIIFKAHGGRNQCFSFDVHGRLFPYHARHLCLDVSGEGLEEGAELIFWNKKEPSADNQVVLHPSWAATMPWHP